MLDGEEEEGGLVESSQGSCMRRLALLKEVAGLLPLLFLQPPYMRLGRCLSILMSIMPRPSMMERSVHQLLVLLYLPKPSLISLVVPTESGLVAAIPCIGKSNKKNDCLLAHTVESCAQKAQLIHQFLIEKLEDQNGGSSSSFEGRKVQRSHYYLSKKRIQSPPQYNLCSIAGSCRSH